MDARRYYDAFAASYEDHRHAGYHRFLDDSELALVLPHAEGREVLEVGSGTGLLLARVACVAARAVGVDLSPGMLEAARGRGLDVHEGDACALPFGDASFDLTYSMKVLAHVPDLERAFAEMARVTRPGGVVVAELYNARSLRGLVKRFKPPTLIGASEGPSDTDVYTRYDRLEDVVRLLPPTLVLERTDGIRVLSPVAAPFNLPGVGPVWAKLERAAGRSRLGRYAGFLVLTARRG
jgi:SAM-dependent methyltransferase